VCNCDESQAYLADADVAEPAVGPPAEEDHETVLRVVHLYIQSTIIKQGYFKISCAKLKLEKR
jgi:hypothetical protein